MISNMRKCACKKPPTLWAAKSDQVRQVSFHSVFQEGTGKEICQLMQIQGRSCFPSHSKVPAPQFIPNGCSSAAGSNVDLWSFPPSLLSKMCLLAFQNKSNVFWTPISHRVLQGLFCLLPCLDDEKHYPLPVVLRFSTKEGGFLVL